MSQQETVPTRQQTPTTTQTPTQAPSVGGGLSAPRVQLKRGVQMMGFDEQSALLAPDEPVQRSGGENTDQVHQAAAAGIASGGGAMPYASQIQNSFGGHDISGIQAHTGSAAKQANQAMGAEAFATGNHVAFAGAPDLHTAAHEAAHVVQQGAGVSLSGGVGQVGDKYENHADKVADAVVKGESAAPILDEMTGGGGGGTQKKSKVQQRAADNVQRVVPPAGGGTTSSSTSSSSTTSSSTTSSTSSSASSSTSSTTPATSPAPDPEAEWRTYCGELEAGVKAVALLITAADQRESFKKLNPVEMRTYASADMTGRMRSEFLGYDAIYAGDGWKHRTAITVMQSTAPHFALYKSLGGAAEMEKFRLITPDERRDLLGVTAGEVSTLLTDEGALTRWRTWRNSVAIAGDTRAMAALGVTDPNDLLKVGGELEKVSTGQAGERMRRLINEQGFEVPEHREHSIRDIANMVKGGMDPWAAMQALKSTWMLKGKLTKNDAGFKKVPILKAIAHVTMVQYGTLSAAFKDELITANGKTPDAATRAEFDANQRDLGAAGFRAWKRAGGAFNPSTHIASYSVEGRGASGAYWMYSSNMTAVCDPAVAGQDVIKACAIEESPEYNDGFVIVELPTADAGMANAVRRPTMWDGLQFDQFAGVDNPNQCFGVTSGGTPEVVVAPTPFASCVVRRNVAM